MFGSGQLGPLLLRSVAAQLPDSIQFWFILDENNKDSVQQSIGAQQNRGLASLLLLGTV